MHSNAFGIRAPRPTRTSKSTKPRELETIKFSLLHRHAGWQSPGDKRSAKQGATPSSLCLPRVGVELLSRFWGIIFAEENFPELEPTPNGFLLQNMVAEDIDPFQQFAIALVHRQSCHSISTTRVLLQPRGC